MSGTLREQPEEVNLIFQEEEVTSEGFLLVTQVGKNLFRLEESDLFGAAFYHDVVEVELLENGSFRVIRVAQPSGLVVHGELVSKGFFEDSATQALLSKVMTAGGNWELTFDGVLTLHLPEREAASLTAELHSLSEQFANRASS